MTIHVLNVNIVLMKPNIESHDKMVLVNQEHDLFFPNHYDNYVINTLFTIFIHG